MGSVPIDKQKHRKTGTGHDMPIPPDRKCKINVENFRCPLQIQLAESELSICTKFQVDNCHILGVRVLKVTTDLFTLRDPEIQDGHAIII